VAYFSATKSTTSAHHLHHAFHHGHTIKTPQPNTHFFQNTPQKPSKTAKDPPVTTPEIFLEITIFLEEL
jgi:hypothetical protein